VIRQDYLLRLIQQAAEAIAKALGLIDRGELQAAEREVEGAFRGLLKVDRQTYGLLDARSLVPLLGPPEVVRALARLSKMSGDIKTAAGHPKTARKHYLRAMQLYAEVGPGDDAQDRKAIEELAALWKKPSS
jgi:hypothetical protein